MQFDDERADEIRVKSVQQINDETLLTQQSLSRLFPRFEMFCEACNIYEHAQEKMMKATEIMTYAIEQLGHSGQHDLDQGMKNVANIFDIWKKNMVEMTNQFKTIKVTIQKDLSDIPKHLDFMKKDQKERKNEKIEALRNAQKHLEKVRKNKKLLRRTPGAIDEAKENISLCEVSMKEMCKECYQESLTLLRGCYGQLFHHFTKIFLSKNKCDFKSQQILLSQWNDLKMIIMYNKILPQKCNALFCMDRSQLLQDNFIDEAREILRYMGIEENYLEDDEVVLSSIEQVKVAIENGCLTSEFKNQIDRQIHKTIRKTLKNVTIQDVHDDDRNDVAEQVIINEEGDTPLATPHKKDDKRIKIKEVDTGY